MKRSKGGSGWMGARTRCLVAAFWLAVTTGGRAQEFAAAPPAEPAVDAGSTTAPTVADLAGFAVTGRLVGFQEVGPFVRFLDDARQGRTSMENPLAALFARSRLLLVLAVLGGGLLLNLTACVLPLIPINLGIIGAGAQASSRRRGFLLGGAYGAGIAGAYGALGVVSVLTGAAFGTLQSSPWFSGGIALVFLLLALAMFDVFTVDLSRFQKAGAPARAGTFGTAFALGAISALLAGACVAPILISTLLLAADLYRAGQRVGVLLPFLLGIGMALPWPFAGAGLSVLPKPGAWMMRVKQLFGVLVLLFALHYARLAWQQGPGTAADTTAPPHGAEGAEGVPWRATLRDALAESRASGRPVFVDLWATWCAACMKMDRTTLRDPRAVAALAAFVPVKLQCERPAEPATAALMAALGARGLPTFVVLRPE